MTGNWSFSYNLASPPPPPAAEPVWAFEDAAASPVDGNAVVLLNRRDGGKALLSAGVYRALSLCQRFDRHENHVQRIRKEFPALPRPELEQAIAAVRKTGLIVDEAALWSRLRGAAKSAPGANPLQLVAIATCDRPATLRRLLASFGENQRAGGLRRRYLVVDDSRDPANMRENQTLVSDAREQLGLDLQYQGQEGLARLLEAVGRAAPEALVAARFLLQGPEGWSGPTHGRTWNRALLLGAGAPLAMVDDDVLARVCTGPGGAEARIELSCGPRSVRFLEGPDDWQRLQDPARRDPLAELDRYLGQPIGDVLAGMAGGRAVPSRLDLVHSYQVRDLTAASRVLLSVCGTVGDPGTAGNGWLYGLKGKSRAHFVRSEAAYRRAKRERNLWVGRAAPTLLPAYLLMSGIIAIDNRETIPPMCPVLRNEDLLLGSMMQYLFPNSAMVDHDFAIPHLPIPSREWEKDSVDGPENLGAMQFLASWLGRRRVGVFSGTLEARWRTLEGDLADMAAVEPRRMGLLVEEAVMLHRATLVRNRQEDLEEAQDAPPYWRADLERSIAHNQAALKSPQRNFLSDLPEGSDPDARHRRFGELMQGFGEGVAHWRRLREIGQEMGRKGGDFPG